MKSRKTVAAVIAAAAVLVAAALIAHAVMHRAPRVVAGKRSAAAASAAGAAYQEPEDIGKVMLFASGADYDKLEAASRKITPAVADYVAKPGLANVANIGDFKGILDPEQRGMIARNQFVVTPTEFTQMFHVYESNEYHRPQKIPAFITTDAMLHTYHVFYDYSLRIVEVTKLSDAAIDMTNAMLAASERDYERAKNPLVKDAARRNVAYFAVARQVLTGKPLPGYVADIAGPDLTRIEDHAGRDTSDILGVTIDFSQFVPRGHYTRSAKLKKYFKGLMWYGLSPFPIKDPNAYPGASKDLEDKTTRQALMIVANLRTVDFKGVPVLKLWDKVYKPTAFYVGTADDFTVYDYARVSDKVYGRSPDVEEFADKAKLQEFMSGVKGLPGPRIENYGGEDATARTGRQFRFMGQRFIPDSRILQELTHPKVYRRDFPKGLDVFAAVGSDRALAIVRKTYKVDDSRGYESQMGKMRAEMTATPRTTWQSNLYYGWLWGLQSLAKPAPKGYPSFMRSNVWIDKCLLAGLGSWTELRHDTILYAKQSATAECGGDEEKEKEPKRPRGYVEPNLEFWTKLEWLNEYTRAGLDSRNLLNAELKDKFARLGEWIEFCRAITIKELTNKHVTDAEYQQMEMFGADLEALTLSFAGTGVNSEVFTETDNDMALIADVHTCAGACLEEGTGRAGAIYVVVPIGGKLYLTRGAVYTQYEFEAPSSNRLTDEEWQKMLGSGSQKPMAGWTGSFFSNMKKPSRQFESFDSGSEPGGC